MPGPNLSSKQKKKKKKNPAMRGGPFINYGPSRVGDIKKLIESTVRRCARLLELAAAVEQTNGILLNEAKGDSMEALYERIPEALRGPVHLFISAGRAPQFRDRERVAYDLPEAEFMEELRRLNGTPAEVLENPELMHLMLPMLRADFEVAETYTYVPEPPLSCPISAYGGTDDKSVSRAELEGWRDHTTGAFSLQMFRGDHFYLQSSESILTGTLISQLRRFADFRTAF